MIEDFLKFSRSLLATSCCEVRLSAYIQKNVTTSTPVLQDFETVKVTLEGFLLGAMFERKVKQGDGKDNDFHLEVSDSQNWKSRHVIVEVPPGPEFCDARKQIFDIVLLNMARRTP